MCRPAARSKAPPDPVRRQRRTPRQFQPVESTYVNPLTTSRRFTHRLPPPDLPGGLAALPAPARGDRGRSAGGGPLPADPAFRLRANWALAKTIADRAGVPVQVAASPPQLGKRINDKIWFANRVRDLLGPGALPPTFAAFGPAAVVGKVRRLARTAERVIVKVSGSAGSFGNVVLEAEPTLRLSPHALRERVLALLRARGWPATRERGWWAMAESVRREATASRPAGPAAPPAPPRRRPDARQDDCASAARRRQNSARRSGPTSEHRHAGAS